MMDVERDNEDLARQLRETPPRSEGVSDSERAIRAMLRLERVSESDRALLVCLNQMHAEEVATVEDRHAVRSGLLLRHFSATYGLQPGDTVEDDGSITRAAQSDTNDE